MQGNIHCLSSAQGWEGLGSTCLDGASQEPWADEEMQG